MPRCAGTSSGKAASAVCDRTDVFVTSDNKVQLQATSPGGRREVVFAGDIDLLLDLAHQFLSAAQTIKERDDIHARLERE